MTDRLGWPALAIAETDGGVGASAVELAEISLWLDTMVEGLAAPWFGLHLRRHRLARVLRARAATRAHARARRGHSAIAASRRRQRPRGPGR